MYRERIQLSSYAMATNATAPAKRAAKGLFEPAAPVKAGGAGALVDGAGVAGVEAGGAGTGVDAGGAGTG